MIMNFTISEKQVNEVYGDKFEDKLKLWQEGQDYVVIKDKRCKLGQKLVFREDILLSLEAKLGLDEPKVEVVPVKLDKQVEDNTIFIEVIENIFPNTRYVRTRSGKTIFVGGKGAILKRGQRITCKGDSMFLGKAQSYP
jgi:hypothetical protein